MNDLRRQHASICADAYPGVLLPRLQHPAVTFPPQPHLMRSATLPCISPEPRSQQGRKVISSRVGAVTDVYRDLGELQLPPFISDAHRRKADRQTFMSPSIQRMQDRITAIVTDTNDESVLRHCPPEILRQPVADNFAQPSIGNLTVAVCNGPQTPS